MNKVKEVFVDMDGVLSNFHARFREVYKSEPDVDYLSNKKKNKIYRQRFKDFINDGHFATLDPMPDLEEGLEFLEFVGEHVPVNILSSTACEEFLHELSGQKKMWLNKFDITYYPIFVPGKKIKKFFSKPGRVLIDDTVSNIEDWESMGGHGIYHKSWSVTITEFYNFVNG